MKNKTVQNLMNAFAGESQARNRYEMYAGIAKKEGWSNIANIFMNTSINEYYHAKEFYKLLVEIVGEDNIPEMNAVTAEYPIAIKSTYDNLMYAANGETEEITLYKEFAEIAKEEGYNKVAAKFNLISSIEAHHAQRYTEVAELLKAEQYLARNDETSWKCMKCGHIHTANNAPAMCPVCDHGSGYFEKFELNV